jgi:hypothetical protein
MSLLQRLRAALFGRGRRIDTVAALAVTQRCLTNWATCAETHLYDGRQDLDAGIGDLLGIERDLRGCIQGLILIGVCGRYPELTSDLGHIEQRLRQRLNGPVSPLSDMEDDDFRLACQHVAGMVDWNLLRQQPFWRAQMWPRHVSPALVSH